jgi:flagellar biosynthesis protein FlhG
MTAMEAAPGRCRVLAVTSGKGGVGKTNVAINVSLALARLGHRVGLLDADFGLGNVDVLLGLAPEAHVGDLLAGRKTMADVVMHGPLGVQVVPASSGQRSLAALAPAERTRLRHSLDQLCASLDYLIIDTASGLSDNVIEMLLLAERVVLVTSLEPSALVDAYAMAKVMSGAAPQTEIGLVVNGARGTDDAQLVFKQLDTAAERFLGRSLRYYGFVADDQAVRDAVLVQRAVVDYLPQSPASRCYRILASRLAGLGAAPRGLHVCPPAPAPVVAPTEVTQCA